jgi:iron-sulfur cluster assembly protein
MTVGVVDPRKPITLTEAAQEYFTEYVKENDGIGVRLGLTGGGCAGFAYDWQLINEYFGNQEKYVQEFDKFVFILDEMAHDLLVGSTIDLEEKGISKVIVVNSPKQASACGCGESITFNE